MRTNASSAVDRGPARVGHTFPLPSSAAPPWPSAGFSLKADLQVPMILVQMTQPTSSGSSMKIVFIVLFRFMLISSGARLGRSRI